MAEKFAFERTEEFNARVREWAERLRVAARSTVSSGVRQNTRLGRSIKTQLHKQDGQIFRISVGFAKEGVYIHVGAGRGYAGFKGGTFYSEARGRRVKVRETSIGKMGTGSRRAFPWLNPQVEAFLPELASIAQEYMVDSWVKSKMITANIYI